VQLDAHSPHCREAIQRLTGWADVLISNFHEEALGRMGLGYDVLRARNPRLIYALVNGFGPRGQEAGKSMVDGAGQARGGLVSVTGDADRGPMMPGAIIADTAGAMQLALGVMTALVARERTGVAQRVDVSSYGAQIWLQMWEITQSAMTSNQLTRQGPHHPNIPGMYGVYETADGKSIFLAFARTEASWQAFCDFAGFPELGTDPRWNSLQKRMGMGNDAEGKIAGQIRPYLEHAFKSKPLAVWEKFLDSQPEIIYNAVYDYDQVLADPQAIANEYIIEMDLPVIGHTKMLGNLVHLSETPGVADRQPPELGQHTEEVLLEFGFSWDEIVVMNDETSEALRRKFAALAS
jgi:formyl-CoA transferase/CoA:oxalate CoA-transferase